MKKNVNSVNISLNKSKNYPSKKRDSQKSSREKNNHSSKEKNSSKNNLIFNKKKYNKNIIPNSNTKCFVIKLNNNITKSNYEHNNKKYQTNNNSISKNKNHNAKIQNVNIIKKPLRLGSQGKITTPNNITFIKNKNEFNLIYNNKTNKSQRKLEDNHSLKTKKISYFKDKLNVGKIDNKNISHQKKKEGLPIYHKKIDKKHKLILINKMKSNIINISSDNIKKNINYYKQKENIILNNNNQIMKNIKDNIYINNKEIKIRNIYYPKSPNNKTMIFKKNISPIKKVSLIRNNQNYFKLNDNKIKKTKASTTFTILNSESKFPNNYGYHEIIYKNSPKKVIQNNNINQEERYKYLKETQKDIYLRNNRPLLEELSTQNNNFNKVSTTILINNQSFNNLGNKILIPYYSTLNSKRNLSLRSSFREDNADNSDYNTKENIYFYTKDNFNDSNTNSKLFFSPKVKKLDISGQYNETETENEDIQTIHYFGEEMLQKNKNYNFSKNFGTYKFCIDGIKNNELKRNNSSNDINDPQKNEQKNAFKSIPFSLSYNEFKFRKYNKRNGSKNGDVLINKNNKRLNHNIINRKRKKNLVMEKSLNEQFISKSNKSKNNENTKDKISCCESTYFPISNIDNDSINEIIREFEKELEDEERKEKLIKDRTKNKLINNTENCDGFMYSFLTDNDNISNVSKGSTNDSKVKKRKVRYYKTKNYELEKNYDFFISPSKAPKKKNKIL